METNLNFEIVRKYSKKRGKVSLMKNLIFRVNETKSQL